MGARSLSRDEARRIALAAQGFARSRPSRPGLGHLRAVVDRLGLIQLDYVNVLLPAHYVVPFSRLGPYALSKLDELVYRRREATEQWAHEASIVTMDTWPLLRHRMLAHRVRPWGFENFMAAHPGYAAAVLRHVRNRGATCADELPAPPEGADRISRDGWSRTVRRSVLEAHFGFGRLAVSERLANFARRYDLASRVVPAEHLRRRVSRAAAERELLRRAARALGVATAADLADYYRMPIGRARPRVAELAKRGELAEVRVDGWRETAFAAPRTPRPRRIAAASLVSPFDPLIWFRPRTRRLFDFDYRIEIYVPRAKRRWGYYVLPFLLDDRLVARVDLKARRDERRLDVLAAFGESGTDTEHVTTALAAELWTLARWLGLERVSVRRRGDLARPLSAAVRRAA